MVKEDIHALMANTWSEPTEAKGWNKASIYKHRQNREVSRALPEKHGRCHQLL